MSGGVVTASLLPEPAPRRHDEETLQRSIVQYLRWALPDNATFHSIPNGGLRHSKVQARLVGTGLRAGVPDLLILWDGSPIYLELKTRRGALSEAQRQMHIKLIWCGATVLVCRSLPEVQAALEGIGVPLRAKVAA